MKQLQEATSVTRWLADGCAQLEVERRESLRMLSIAADARKSSLPDKVAMRNKLKRLINTVEGVLVAASVRQLHHHAIKERQVETLSKALRGCDDAAYVAKCFVI